MRRARIPLRQLRQEPPQKDVPHLVRKDFFERAVRDTIRIDHQIDERLRDEVLALGLAPLDALTTIPPFRARTLIAHFAQPEAFARKATLFRREIQPRGRCDRGASLVLRQFVEREDGRREPLHRLFLKLLVQRAAAEARHDRHLLSAGIRLLHRLAVRDDRNENAKLGRCRRLTPPRAPCEQDSEETSHRTIRSMPRHGHGDSTRWLRRQPDRPGGACFIERLDFEVRER